MQNSGQFVGALTKDKQSLPVEIGDIFNIAEKHINDFDLRGAKKFADELSKKILDSPTDIKLKLRGIITRLHLVALPLFYLDQDIINVFREEGFVDVLRNEVPDPQERLKAKLLDYWYDQRDQLRQNIVVALHENQDLLTNTQIKTDDGFKKGTIANWLADYHLKLGIDLIDQVEIVDYLFHSESAKNLNERERQLVGKLFNFYEFLKLSSQTAAGLEEELIIIDEGGQVKDFNHGKLIPIFGRKYYPKTISLDDKFGQLISAKISVGNKDLINLQPTLQIMKTTDPAFFFDLKDEEEVDRFREQIADGARQVAGSLEGNLRQLAEEVVKEHNFKFKDEVAQRRFVQIFVSFMKDVRDIIEVREVMLKSQDNGGLGLTSDKVEAIIKIFSKIKQELPAKIKQWQELGKKSEPAKVVPSEPKIIPEEKIIPVLPPQPEIKPAASDSEKVATWRQEMLEQIAKMAPVSAPEKKVVIKPRLVDVKAPPRVFGPLEELKEMNLVDFRRLGPTANEVANKIWAKIQLIGETGIGRKYQATRAWQASRVYRMYVNLGRASIEQVKPVTEIITQYQTQGEDSLTVAEFEAIADLNQKLRF